MRVAWQISMPWCLPCYQSEEMKILINNDTYPRVGIETKTVALQSHAYALDPQLTLVYILIIKIRKYLCKFCETLKLFYIKWNEFCHSNVGQRMTVKETVTKILITRYTFTGLGALSNRHKSHHQEVS